MPRKKQTTTKPERKMRNNTGTTEAKVAVKIECRPDVAPAPRPECASCRFFRLDTKDKAPWKNTIDTGTCFLKPPAVNNGHFERPPVMISDFCKEWEPREKGADE